MRNHFSCHFNEFDCDAEIAATDRCIKGMQITIYMAPGQESLINLLLLKIEKLLRAADITPGVIDSSDRALGNFISIRHQGSKAYRPSDQSSSYNPESIPDIFIDYEVFSNPTTSIVN